MNDKFLLLLQIWFAVVVVVVNGTAVMPEKDDESLHCESRSKKNECHDNDELFFQCPQSCSDFYQLKYAYSQKNLETGVTNVESASKYDKAILNDDPDAIFDINLICYQEKNEETLRKKVSFERLEGYTTVLMSIPLSSRGMSLFYYTMLDQLLQLYPYTVQGIVLPLLADDEGDETSVFDVLPELKLHLPSFSQSTQEQKKQRQKKRTMFVMEEIYDMESHPLIQYLEQQMEQDKLQLDEELELPDARGLGIYTDRVSVYIISSTGVYLEKRITPEWRQLEPMVRYYNKEISGDLLSHKPMKVADYLKEKKEQEQKAKEDEL